MGLDRREPRPAEYGLVCTARFGKGPLGSAAHHCDGLDRYTNCPKSNGYPLHPSEQDMISAAGIKDQELTIIVSIMLIELALLRLRRAALFKRLALTRKARGRAASANWVGATRGTINLGRRASSKAPSEFRNPSMAYLQLRNF